MADSNVPITAGSGTLVDTRTVGGEHRQVVNVGDETAATIAEVVGQALAVRLGRVSSGTITSVTASVTTVTLLASNTSRQAAAFFNDSTATLYLALASGASTSSYSVKLGPDAYFELFAGISYTGIVTGIWSAANGACKVTELT